MTGKTKLLKSLKLWPVNNYLIKIRDLTAGYGDKPVLKNISLDIFNQDFLGIIGPNGGGKTTLIKLILGLLKPYQGTIYFERKDLKNSIGYIPQTNMIDKKFPILVSEVIRSGLLSSKKLSKQFINSKLQSIISEMDLDDIKHKPIGELSGGQLQRTLLARAIINDPELLILDEPNSYIDKQSELHLYDLLKKINTKTAIILVSHDIGTIISTVKNIACVNETLHYHSGTDIDPKWFEKHFACPFDLLSHGKFPHRILKSH